MKISFGNATKITAALLVIGMTEASQMPGSDQDQHGCVGSAGYEWCPGLSKCVQPWMTPCPTSPPLVGGDKDQHGCVASEGYEWCPQLKKCVQPWQTPCPTSPPLVGGDKDQHGCVASEGYTWCPQLKKCVQPWQTPCPTSPPLVGGDKDQHGCVAAEGYTWCPQLNKCVQPWLTPCPTTNSNGNNRGLLTGSDRDEHGCIGSAGYTWCASTESCIRSWETKCPDLTKVPTPGSDRDEHGCIGSAGYTWCESLESCIRPWETTCPDPTKKASTPAPAPGSDRDEHGCIGSAGYTWCETLASCIRPWETDCPSSSSMVGGTDEYGCSASTGTTWCPEKSACIQPWMEDCPVAGAATYDGPTEIMCESDMRCNVNDECRIDIGGFTIGGPYLTGFNGTLSLPDNCVAKCIGCVPSNVAVGSVDTNNDEQVPTETAKATSDFTGPVDLECDDGECDLDNRGNSDCMITLASFTHLNGVLSIPATCKAQCSGCHKKTEHRRRALRGDIGDRTRQLDDSEVSDSAVAGAVHFFAGLFGAVGESLAANPTGQ